MTELFIAVVCLLAVPLLAKEPTRPPITGIAGVRIYASNPAESQKFYSERLQLPRSSCGADCMRYDVGRGQFVEVLNAAGRNNEMAIVLLRTPDADGLRKFIAARGIKVPGALTRNPDGSREFEVTDPEGHRVGFYQFGKGTQKNGGISHRIIHAGFVVKDRAVMDQFYKEVLGFRAYWYGGWTAEHPIWVSSQVPDGTDWIEYMLDIPANASHRDLGVQNHFSLGVDDIKEAAAGLAKSGWQPGEHEHSQMGRDGKYQLNAYDPDDVRVEFMEFKPAEKPCCSEFTGPHPSASD